ncbi:MAG: AAA family ATPase [Nitrososphaerales archaeon]|nr:AAA family ATPase [Nitrososphaerales archaeon]
MNRISTGSTTLDLILNGGFQTGSLISITGPPGSGKTIFATNWIYNNAEKFDKCGLYVSFIEGYKNFVANMNSLGLDFERLERKGKLKFVEMVTVKGQALPTIIEHILHEITKIGASMLVIDSFSVMSQAIGKAHDVRILAHMILSKIVREMGCTTMLIIEKMSAKETFEPVEFLSDFIIHLSKVEVNGALLRYLKILKARGTEVQQPQLAFTLKDGFKAFQPISMGGFAEPTKRFKIIPHGKDHYSSGITNLDRTMGMMFRSGSYNLLEVGMDVTLPPERLFRVTVSNALNQGTCVVILPPQGLSALTVWRSLEPFVDEETLKCNLKIVDFKATLTEKVEPYVILFEGRSLKEDMMRFWNVISDFRMKSGKPVLTVVGFDTLEYVYGLNEILKVLGEDLAKIKNLGDVRLNIVRPECAISDSLRSLATTHIIMREICGAIFLQGIKPKTPLLNVELHTNEETEIKLTPVL